MAIESDPNSIEPRPEPGELRVSSIDEPIEAVVIDVHPAVAEVSDYPYGTPSAAEHGFFSHRPDDFNRYIPLLRFERPAPAKYKVPQRFGMSAILGIMTALALLFGGFRFLNAEPVVYLFFGIQSVVICLVQMFNGKMPRAASAIAGAIMAPLFAVRLVEATGIPIAYTTSEWIFWTISMLPLAGPMGAFLGYLTGTCAAGIFLVMDYLEPYLQGCGLAPQSAGRPTG